jgi:GT2 family glycosyltransferase
MIVSANRAGIAASWNKLVRHQPADVIVLINDDIEVVPHWLDVLVYSVMKNQQVGMVSLNQYVSLTKGQHREAFAHMLPHEAQPIVDYHESNLMTGQGQLLASHGSIFAFRRDSYDLAGGFDERYFVYYEECDFGVSLCEKGFIHAIASYPIVYHQGGATLSDLNNLDANAQLVRSRCLFHAKWKKSVIEMRARYQAQAKASGVLENLNEWNTALIHLDDQART